MPAEYTVEVVDRWGQRLGGLPEYQISKIEKELNEVGNVEVSVPILGLPVVPTNLVPDPSFENLASALSGWLVGTGMAHSNAQAEHGVSSLRLSTGSATTSESTSPSFAISASTAYTLAASFINQLSGGTLRVGVRQFDSGGATISTTYITSTSTVAWQRLTTTFTSAANAVTAQIVVSATSAVGLGYVDKVQLETGSVAGIFSEGTGGYLPRVAQDEIRILRNGSLFFQGPVVDGTADHDRLRLRVEGVGWWLKQRVFGRLGGTNLLPNASFDSFTGNVPTSWTNNGLASVGSTSRKLVGANAVEVSGAADGEGYLGSPEFPATGDVEYTLRVWYFIRPDVPFTGPAREDRGIMIYLRATNPVDPDFDRVTYIPLRENTPRGIWTPAVVSTKPPTGVVSFAISARLHAGGFTIVYDQASLKPAEVSEYNEVDQAQIIKRIVDHSKDPAFGKTNHNIRSELVPLVTGVNRTRKYEHTSHPNCWDAIHDFTTIFNGCDVDVVLTDGGNTRTLTAFFPSKGSYKPTLTLELGRNIAHFSSYQVQGRESAQAIAQQGTSGDQPEEVAAVDTTAHAGAGMEKVVSAPEYATVDQLLELAQVSLAKRKRPPVVAEVTTFADAEEIITNLFVGDTVRVVISHGWVQLNEIYKVTRISVDPVNDIATIGLEIP